MRTALSSALMFLALIGSAKASTVTAVGAVKALTDTSQVLGLVGTAGFDEGPTSGNVPLNQYSAQGLTWAVGSFQTILPGVTTQGSATNPIYGLAGGQFPTPIGGGGIQVGQISGGFGGVATFSGNGITQVGLTAAINGDQYLTVWSKSGAILGQVNWSPTGVVQFIGIDTMGVSIGMVAYGNDDLWAGGTYSIGGSTIYSDTWLWATGKCKNDAQCDDQNLCTTDTCTVATGVCVHAANTLSCDDGNSCTQNDTCAAGACVSGAPVTCAALDGCHAVGACNPMSGVCSNPAKQDGSACNDGNSCTQSDTCQAGTCTGTKPVTCAPPDACHDIGACDLTTGMCFNPAKPDGTVCDDSNACTTADSCQQGVCAGSGAVVCSAVDACHDDGVCDTKTGTCSTPAKAEGAPCNDGDSCSVGDSCKSGVCAPTSTTVCAALDKCHDVGACDGSGQCSNPPKNINCKAKTVCEQDGTCDGATGLCINAAKPDGVPCGKGFCIAGTCSDETGNTTSVTGTGAGGGSSTATGSGGASATSTGTGTGGAGAGGASTGSGGASGVSGVGGGATSGTASTGATSTSGGEGSVTPAGGCGCSTPGTEPVRAPWLGLGLGLGLLLPSLRRRRKATRPTA